LGLVLLAWDVARGQEAPPDGVAPVTGPCYTLEQCLDLALEQNPDVQVARKGLEEAAGAVMVARAGFLPSVSSYANYERLEPDYANLAGTSTNNRPFIWNVNLRVYETVYSGGGVRGQMDIARLQDQSRMLDYESTVDQTIMDVRVAFCDILYNQADVEVHQQAVDFLGQQAQSERNKLQVGTGQKLNVLRAEVNLALEQSALVDSRNRLHNAYLRLAELLAIPCPVDAEQPPFDVQGELRYERLDMPLDECLNIALSRRPELGARANDIDVQRKQLIVDRSALLPHVQLYGGYDAISEPDRTVNREYYDGYVAGFQVNWNVFDGFATRGRMDATRARIEEMETGYEALRLSIHTEVLRAYRELQKAEEIIDTQSANAALARQSLDLAQQNFGLGLISQLELLQSRLDLTRAQTAELSARFDYNAALARLQRAMGSDFLITEDSGRQEPGTK